MSLADLQTERPNFDFPINNEEDAQIYKAMNQLAEPYFKAKWDHYIDSNLSRLKFTAYDLDLELAAEFDKDMKERVELMYSYDESRHERKLLRNKFLIEMNKKTTLKDIGAKLDEFILDSKANLGHHYHAERHTFETPNAATRDQTTVDFDWKLNLIQSFDSIKPYFIEDRSQLADDLPPEKKRKQEIIDEVEFNDSKRQHDIDSLTQDEKTEIALFHSMKQDPFYKHHLRNFLSQFAEQTNDNIINFGTGKGDMDAGDFTKFDRINLFDFRRMLPKKERAD